MKKLKNLFKRSLAIYKIVSIQHQGHEVYLIKKRTSLFSWDYVYDVTTVGFDNREVTYEAFYTNLFDAEQRVKIEIENDKLNKSISKTVKLIYADDKISSM